MAFRFVHTGDLHLDSPFMGLSAAAPAESARIYGMSYHRRDITTNLARRFERSHETTPLPPDLEEELPRIEVN